MKLETLDIRNSYRLAKVKRNVLRILLGLSFIFLTSLMLGSKKVFALDDDLLVVMLAEITKLRNIESAKRINNLITLRQAKFLIPNFVSTSLQPVLLKRDRRLRRLNYLIGAILNFYMFVIDFMRK